jgi:hypothetical protein
MSRRERRDNEKKAEAEQVTVDASHILDDMTECADEIGGVLSEYEDRLSPYLRVGALKMALAIEEALLAHFESACQQEQIAKLEKAEKLEKAWETGVRVLDIKGALTEAEISDLMRGKAKPAKTGALNADEIAALEKEAGEKKEG